MTTKTARALNEADAKKALKELQGRPGAILEDVSLESVFKWPSVRLSEITFRRVDFTGVNIFGGLFGRPVFDRCRFESCGMDGLNARGAVWSGCLFQGVRTGSSLLGLLYGCRFEDVQFENCRLDALTCEKCVFLRCRFTGLRARRLRWTDCRIEEMTITGRLSEVLFDDNTCRNVDLTGLDIEDTSFIGSVRGVAFPQRIESFVVPATAWESVARELAGALTPAFQEELEGLARIRAKSGMVLGITEGLFEGYEKAEVAKVVRALFEHRVRSQT